MEEKQKQRTPNSSCQKLENICKSEFLQHGDPKFAPHLGSPEKGNPGTAEKHRQALKSLRMWGRKSRRELVSF